MSVIRPANEQDYVAMDSLMTAAVRTGCSPVYSPELIESWVGKPKPERFQLSGKKGSVYYVCTRDDVLLGFCAIRLKDRLVDAVFVSPDAGGQGVGGQMLEYLFAIADEHDIEELVLESSLNAVGFYEKYGFEEYQRKAVTLNDGLTIEAVLMRRQRPGE